MTNPVQTFASKVVSSTVKGYQGATQGLQNYGRNVAKNMAKAQTDFHSGKAQYYAGNNPFPNPLKASSYK